MVLPYHKDFTYLGVYYCVKVIGSFICEGFKYICRFYTTTYKGFLDFWKPDLAQGEIVVHFLARRSQMLWVAQYNASKGHTVC